MAKRRKPPVKLKKIKRLANGLVIRFKDSKGRFTSPDARKNLTSAVYKKVGKKLVKTNLTFNKIKNGKAVPQKFTKRFIMKSKILNTKGTAPIRAKTGPTVRNYKFDARYPIEDNIIIHASEFLKYAKRRKSGVILDINYRLPDKSPMKHSFVFKNFATSLIVQDITNTLVNNIYRSKYRMSNMKDSSRPDNKYLRSISLEWKWAGI